MKKRDKVLSGLYTNDNLNYTVVRYTRNPALLFYDNNGNPLKNISVHYLGKVHKPDPVTQLVFINNLSKEITPMIVYHDGIRYEFELWGKLKYIEDTPSLWPFVQQQNNSYFTKTEYKCGDTIHVEANASDFDYVQFYGSSANLLYSSPIKKSNVYKETYINSIILKEECPYLTDGNIGIYLSKNKDKHDNENVFVKSFNYITCDYTLSAEINNRKHLKDNPPTLSILVTEPDNNYSDNDFIQIYTYTHKVKRAWADSVFVPQTLVIDTIPLTINKEIQYTLPHTIFPQADIEYNIRINLYRNGKIAQYKLFEIESLGSADMLVMSEKDYKLDIQKINSKESLSDKAVLEAFGRDRLLSRQEIVLPYSANINPVASYYKVTSGNISDSIFIKSKDISPIDYNIQPYGIDSVTISIENPSGYSFWYTIWGKNKILKQDYTSKTRFNLEKVKDGEYILRLEYMYGGQIQELQTKLYEQKQDTPVKPKQSTVYNRIYLLNTKETVWNTKKAPVNISYYTPAYKKETKYEKILDLLSKTGSSYSSSTNLGLAFKNKEAHQAKFIVLVDTTKKDPYDRLEVYKVSQTSIALSQNKSYILYILSDGTLAYKQPVKLQNRGDYFLTLDMAKLDNSDAVNKEIGELVEPFEKNKYLKVTVLDNYGDPVIGANVLLKGTNNGRISDLDGVAMLTLPGAYRGDIEISFIGMKPQRITYRGQAEIKVKMEEDSYILSD